MRMRKKGKAIGFAVELVADGRGVVTTIRSMNKDREIEGKLLVGITSSRKGKEMVQHG